MLSKIQPATKTSLQIPIVSILVLVLTALASAQNIKYTENNLDQSLRGALQVDPTTLNLSFSVDLGSYPGRGPSLPVSLTWSSKVWRIRHVQSWQGLISYHTQATPEYAEHSVSGWTTSLDAPWIEYVGAQTVYDDFGQPMCVDCDGAPSGGYYIERVTVHMPDGSSHEMRKNDTPLFRYFYQGSPPLAGIYVSVDGTRMKYDADQAILYLPDGGRYMLTAPGGVEYLDRNGNKLKQNESTKQWTDTLGRVIGFVLDNTVTSQPQTISLPGVGSGTLTYSLVWKKLNDALTVPISESQMPYKADRTFAYPSSPLSPHLYISDGPYGVCSAEVRFNPVVLAEIILPNNSKYTFAYNTYGEIEKATLPTGGYYKYGYSQIPGLDPDLAGNLYGQANRGVNEYRVCESGNCTSGQELVWTYTATNPGGVYKTTLTNPLGEKSERSMHVSSATEYGLDDARAGRAYDEKTFNGSQAMMRRSLTEWTYDGPLPGGHSTATRNARPDKQVEILLDTTGDALTATTMMSYDIDLNQTVVNKYAYATVNQTTAQSGAITSMPLGTLLRTDETQYLLSDSEFSSSWTNYRNRHLLSLPTKQFVRNGSGVTVAAAKFYYDERALSTYTGTVPGWVDPGNTVRGNLTTTHRWQNFNGTSFQTYHPSGNFMTAKIDYDQCGSVRKTTDANDRETLIFYDDMFSDSLARNSFAYPTRTETPVPDTSGYYATNQRLKSHSTYDFQTGKVTKTKDANEKETIATYDGASSLNRLQKVTSPDGGETSYEYGDTPGSVYIRTLTKQSASVQIDDYVYFDGLGRPWRAAHYEGNPSPNTWSVTDTQYDTLGRVWKVSNPYFAANLSGGVNPSGAWTTTTYDAPGRVLTVTMPDGSVITTNYNGNIVEVTDQATKKRKSVTDALGRLTQVFEDPSGLNYQTDYQYDTLANLVKVTQGTQNRYFVYDSLSRLLRARNPEQNTNGALALTPPADQATGNSQWSLKYVYDSNGNLTSRTDARNVTTNYGYDAINRNIWVNYSDGITPVIERHYDGALNGKGRPHYQLSYNTHPVTSAAAYSYTIINSYDSMGRPLSRTQNLLDSNGQWAPFTITRSYDLAGQVLTQSYPSNRTVTNSYGASGRMSSFTGTLGDGASRNYATGISYTAAGLMSREAFGMQSATLYHNLHYNNRQQLVDIRLGDNPGDEWNWGRGALIFYYGTAARDSWNAFANSADNNGNVLRQVNYVPLQGGGYVIPQLDDYGYDNLNRVTSVTEAQQNSGGTWTFNLFTQNFQYDRWGNRTVGCSPCQPGVTGDIFTIDAATNRITAKNGFGMTYDSAGNQTYDATGTRWFDGENKMYKALQGGTTSHYVYDADGRRVRRIVGTTETWQVYGMEGELIAEYNVNGSSSSPQKEYGYRDGQMLIVAQVSPLEIRWLVTDHLGSPRMNIRGTGTDGGSLTSLTRHDYLPFGEELFAGVGIRSSSYGYEPPADGVRQKFGSKERDVETGLDYFGARYYASVQGRFTSPDPLEFWMLDKKKQHEYIPNPQRWNKYTYVLNNPLRYVDPNGLAEIPAWDGLNRKLQEDLAKRGLNQKTWNNWNNDKRQQILNTRAALMAAGVWGNVTSIGFGGYQLRQEQVGTRIDAKGGAIPVYGQTVTVTKDNEKGWAVILETNADIGPTLEKAGYKSESAVWNHPEGLWTYKQAGDDIVSHVIRFRTGMNLLHQHFDTGGGKIWSKQHFEEWWHRKGGATQDDITRSLRGTSAAQYLRGISPSIDKLLSQGNK